MPDSLPWIEVLRRRNGLPPALATIARGVTAALSTTQDDYALSPQSPESRCGLFDLPTSMCHHCKEIALSNTVLAQAAYDAYSASRAHKSFDGDQLPAWAQLSPEIQDGWLAAVAAVAAPADQAVRGVQQWMALDLHTALGHAADQAPDVTNPGHPTWNDWWTRLLADVRTQAPRTDRLLADPERPGRRPLNIQALEGIYAELTAERTHSTPGTYAARLDTPVARFHEARIKAMVDRLEGLPENAGWLDAFMQHQFLTPDQTDPARIRTGLLQAAVAAVAWIEVIDLLTARNREQDARSASEADRA
ncbi:hypothetical protein ACEZCY_14525 [Streptacidiphilus sp. N1-12]|uniref:Uncharacterized protein n=2 Tax=Streptacidiphilus alkalitolerans TaxID=3342712 RepID=A0ABV6WEH2_9ACTN